MNYHLENSMEMFSSKYCGLVYHNQVSGGTAPALRGESEPSLGERLSVRPARRVRHRRPFFCRGHPTPLL